MIEKGFFPLMGCAYFFRGIQEQIENEVKSEAFVEVKQRSENSKVESFGAKKKRKRKRKAKCRESVGVEKGNEC